MSDGTATAVIGVRRWCAVVGLLALLAACSPARDRPDAADRAPDAPTWDGRFDAERQVGRPGWETCGAAQCTDVQVPVTGASEPLITLKVARRPAVQQPAVGTVLLHMGGPGLRMADALAEGFALDPSLHESYDVITWNPRGTAGDSELACGGAEEAYARSDHIAGDDEAVEALAACAEAAEPLPRHLGLGSQVADAVAVLDAAGVERADLVGFSWGTWVLGGLAAAHPERVGRVYLDGLVAVGAPYLQSLVSQADAVEATLDATLERCGELARCDPADSTVAATVLARTRDDGVPVGVSGALRPGDLFHAVIASLYNPGAGDVDVLVDAALDGDGEFLWREASGYRARLAYGATIFTSCADIPDAGGATLSIMGLHDGYMARGQPWAAGIIGEYRVCDRVPAAPAAAGPLTISVPTMIVTTAADTITPFDAAAVGASFTDAHLVRSSHVGHTAYGFSECVRLAMTAFLRDGAPPPAACDGA